ncbi:hypothetical protein HP567_028965 [Brevibacillus sp. M2.1A]|uniref:helicase C-terminal domain-containing protein n=1 Tax=Brevibacillus sp. M2.1A TaxID=2738980 RepID=UPI00156AD107|nr:helicase C-terminal domain-containing protein [Brevibacillus sp. M2.1A]MCC8438570.1 hypothetical protein [Brevibacillus sp. M2.1A]
MFVYEYLSVRKLPWPLVKQDKNANQNEVIKEFIITKGLLLETGVFWEGIDIKGQDLSQVIITRLPFPVPDPILGFKGDKVENKEAEVLVPEMIVKLRQGFRRLIRNECDKGIVSILDTRIINQPKK